MTATPAFDALSAALFDGPVKAIDVKLVPGTQEGRPREELATALLESMTRMGLVSNGYLTDLPGARHLQAPGS